MRASVSARWAWAGLGWAGLGYLEWLWRRPQFAKTLLIQCPSPSTAEAIEQPGPKVFACLLVCLLASMLAGLLPCLLASMLAGLLVCCLLAGSGEGHTKTRRRAVRRGSDRPSRSVCLREWQGVSKR